MPFITIKFAHVHIISTGLYERRVALNAKGDVKSRIGLFKLGFRTKLNNWWNANAVKILNEKVAKKSAEKSTEKSGGESGAVENHTNAVQEQQ